MYCGCGCADTKFTFMNILTSLVVSVVVVVVVVVVAAVVVVLLLLVAFVSCTFSAQVTQYNIMHPDTRINDVQVQREKTRL